MLLLYVIKFNSRRDLSEKRITFFIDFIRNVDITIDKMDTTKIIIFIGVCFRQRTHSSNRITRLSKHRNLNVGFILNVSKMYLKPVERFKDINYSN